MRPLEEQRILVTGRLFDGTRESTAHGQAYDAGARRRLWEESERLTRAA